MFDSFSQTILEEGPIVYVHLLQCRIALVHVDLATVPFENPDDARQQVRS